MPQEVQIVPKWLHSHVETYINDYTQFEDAAAVPVDTNTKSICVFRSSKGIDNVFVKKMQLKDFKNTFGDSDYYKYGQPLMMPIAMLTAGSSTCYCMRVMPDDAYAANCVLSMLYKFDDASGKMIIKYRASYIDKSVFSTVDFYKTAKNFKKYLRNYAQAMRSDTPDSDGFMRMPIAAIRMAGRGVYGNTFRWRIARNIDYENDYGIKMYSFESLDTAKGLSKVATYVGAAVTSRKYTQTTLINDILDDQETGSVVMPVEILEDNVEELYEQFKAFVEGLDESMRDDIPDVDCWDIFFGRGIGNDTPNKNMDIIPGDILTNDISVDDPQGTSLMGGDDGAFSEDNDAQAIYEAEIACYSAAFEGSYDKTILSTRRVPCDVMLDANYPFEVKEVMADLANTRESCLLYLDAGLETTLGKVDNMIEQYKVFNTRNLVKEWQHYQVRDFETKKKVDVTVTYFYAMTLANHYHTYGNHIPFVKSYSRLTGHVKNSLEPAIDDVDMEIKEKLYNNRFNYYEVVEENNYQRSAQNTAQMINSDLMEENNMNTLFELKRRLELDCWASLYDFTSAEERARFSESEMAKFAAWPGTKVDTLSIKFDVNEWEMERSIVHCYVAVQFRNLMKRVLIEIDVNKRNFLG